MTILIRWITEVTNKETPHSPVRVTLTKSQKVPDELFLERKKSPEKKHSLHCIEIESLNATDSEWSCEQSDHPHTSQRSVVNTFVRFSPPFILMHILHTIRKIMDDWIFNSLSIPKNKYTPYEHLIITVTTVLKPLSSSFFQKHLYRSRKPQCSKYWMQQRGR